MTTAYFLTRVDPIEGCHCVGWFERREDAEATLRDHPGALAMEGHAFIVLEEIEPGFHHEAKVLAWYRISEGRWIPAECPHLYRDTSCFAVG